MASELNIMTEIKYKPNILVENQTSQVVKLNELEKSRIMQIILVFPHAHAINII